MQTSHSHLPFTLFHSHPDWATWTLTSSHSHLPYVGGCSFGGLGVCSCRVRVCVGVGGVVLLSCACASDLLILYHCPMHPQTGLLTLSYDFSGWATWTPTSSPSHLYYTLSHLAFTRSCYHQYCMMYGIRRGGRWRGVYCAMAVHAYCNRVGFAGWGGGHNRMIDSHNKALK